jgi:hypothetical protein
LSTAGTASLVIYIYIYEADILNKHNGVMEMERLT